MSWLSQGLLYVPCREEQAVEAEGHCRWLQEAVMGKASPLAVSSLSQTFTVPCGVGRGRLSASYRGHRRGRSLYNTGQGSQYSELLTLSSAAFPATVMQTFDLEPYEADSHKGDSLVISPGHWGDKRLQAPLETCSPRNPH